MKRDARVYIEDILEAITKIEEYMKGLGSDKEFYPPSQKTTGLPVDECGKTASARCH